MGIHLPLLRRRLFSGTTFSPAALFAASEPGVWYDPSDLTTMFQDAAGTTPVTGVEQPVGLRLDKSKGLVLGSELVTNGDFASATGWTVGTNWAIIGGAATATAAVYNTDNLDTSVTLTAGRTYKLTFSISGYSAGSLRLDVVGTQSVITGSVTANGSYTYYFAAASGGAKTFRFTGSTGTAFTGSIDNISVRELPGNHAFQTTDINRPVLSARVNRFVNTATLATQNVTTVAANYTLRFEGTGSIALSGTASGTYSAGSHTVTCTAGTLTATVTGTVTNADIRVANDGVGLPVYQAVTSGTEGSGSGGPGTITYDTTGFPLYLRYNGTNSTMQTAAIDFTSTDKMSVFAGVRKLSDAAAMHFVERSASTFSNNGAFTLNNFNPQSGAVSSLYSFISKGTIYPITAPRASGYVAPITNVVTALGDIPADSAILRVNGSQVASDNGDQGTENYGNHPLYLGARAGSSGWFNGRDYGLIVLGRTATATEIASTEAWLNARTKAYA
ncbi:MAG: hypothetical protein ABFE08_17745 [Armatimonadia bacterium]